MTSNSQCEGDEGPHFAFNQKDFRPFGRKSFGARCKINILQRVIFMPVDVQCMADLEAI